MTSQVTSISSCPGIKINISPSSERDIKVMQLENIPFPYQQTVGDVSELLALQHFQHNLHKGYEYKVLPQEMYVLESTTSTGKLCTTQHQYIHALSHTMNVGTLPKKVENFSASIVADVTINFRSFLRATT